MKTVFVDANVFLRFFAADDPAQHKRAAALLRKAAAGEVALATGPPVLFEIAWTLRAAYRQPPEAVLAALAAIAAMPGLKLTDADLVEEALRLARPSGVAFADAYILACARQDGADEIASFNRKHFERLGAPLAKL
jgi:predicted nucleic acid-binding protein